MDSISHLVAFLAVARTGSFSEAARTLDTSPSVITKKIKQLEIQFATKLFNRTTHHVQLTPTGHSYLPQIDQIVTDYETLRQAKGRLVEPRDRRLRIKAPTSLTVNYLLGCFITFQRQHPGVTIDMLLINRTVDPQEEDIDITFGMFPQSYPGVIEETIGSYPRIVVAAPSYLETAGPLKRPEDLHHHNCLSFVRGGETWTFDTKRGPKNINIRGHFSSNSEEVLLSAALQGHGVARLWPRLVGDAIKSGNLRQVLKADKVGDLWLRALVPRDRAADPLIRELIALVKTEFLRNPPNR